MMTMEMVLAQEVVAGIVQERMKEAQDSAIVREARRLQIRHRSPARILLQWRPWRLGRRGASQPAASAA